MPLASLSPLQARILHALAGIEPAWTLTGGGALAGFHTGHRTTRDLDLFWRSRKLLEGLPRVVCERIEADGLRWRAIQSGDTFSRIEVTDGTDSCLVDLVVEPWPSLTTPERVEVDGRSIEVDSAHEILVNKLVAMLGRSELRDLEDVAMLLDRGGDYPRALADAPRKDGGFSPLVLAWLLQGWKLDKLAESARWEPERVERLGRFREELVARLLASARP